MGTLIAIIIIVALFYLLRYLFLRDPSWIFRKFINRKIRKMQRDQQKAQRKNNSRESRSSSSSSRRRYSSQNSRIIPPEYGEDVEYVEIKEFSKTKITVEDSSGKTEYTESQISDVEWIELK